MNKKEWREKEKRLKRAIILVILGFFVSIILFILLLKYVHWDNFFTFIISVAPLTAAVIDLINKIIDIKKGKK